MTLEKPMFSTVDGPLGAILTCKETNFEFDWGNETKFRLTTELTLSNSHSISRHVARVTSSSLYPIGILQRTEVDNWLTLTSGPLMCKNNLSIALSELNKALAPRGFLVGNAKTIADLELFGNLYKNSAWHQIKESENAPVHVLRWYHMMEKEVAPIMNSFPEEYKKSLGGSKTRSSPVPVGTKVKKEDVGKFVELPGAKMGEVVVRFPPEASGFLHIGHAKAALLNQHYQKAFKGKLIMRFDDTNPAKESAEYEKVILEDLKLLQVEPDVFTHTSDLFDKMISLCEEFLIKRGHAYVDDTDAETMKKEREERKESRNRSNSAETNLKNWNEMKAGTVYGLTLCVRAKINMNSDNGCMRDPTIYRCKSECHVRTGTKYKVYPTYDFACPIVDSLEGVTHALRTTEYHDRDEQYYWFIEKLELRSLHIYEYSRLNMNNTVLSKRKLAWFVNEGYVDGWDDPRFPTVRGILRKGMTVEGLKDFILAQGSSRSVVNMEWDKIWSFNKKVIDVEASRYTALEGNLIPVNVNGVKEDSKSAQKHPKDPSKGMKAIWTGPKVFIEAEDAKLLKEGENATFINWGNLLIKKIHKVGDTVQSVDADPNLSNTDFKKTLKLTWLSETNKSPWTPLTCFYFDNLITKNVLGKDDDFKNFIGKDTMKHVDMVGDDEIKTLKENEIIQIQRKGFFRVDKPYAGFSSSSCKESSVVLFAIPDGHSNKESPTLKKAPASANAKSVEKSTKNTTESSSNDASQIDTCIRKQGDKVRQLKGEKASKENIMVEVNLLKGLKENFKNATGKEWTPDANDNAEKAPQTVPTASDGNFILISIKDQGDKVRQLKTEKASKDAIMAQVALLKSLKEDFKKVTGQDWTPDISIVPAPSSSPAASAPATAATPTAKDGNSILLSIKEKGDKVRQLKSEKASKDAIMSEVAILKLLKEEFKKATGQDWTLDISVGPAPSASPAGAAPAVSATPSAKDGNAILLNIKEQGDKVRQLKSEKATKEAIMSEVAILKSLKEEFKKLTGQDWTPDISIAPAPSASPATSAPATAATPTAKDGNTILISIKEKGDKVRQLKSEKASKDAIMSEVAILKSLKEEFKKVTGQDWTPDISVCPVPSASPPASTPAAPATPTSKDGNAILLSIKEQGDKVRQLKSEKASKETIMPEVATLKSLKEDFKTVTGQDWTPDTIVDTKSSVPSVPSSNGGTAILEAIKEQGNKVRQLKGEKATKEAIMSEVAILKSLKDDYKKETGSEWTLESGGTSESKSRATPPRSKPNESQSKKSKQPKEKPVKEVSSAESSMKKQTRLGLESKKEENLSEWYTQVITKSEMIEYYNVSGCYILRPWSYAIWDSIKDFLDGEIKKLGVENCYFPIFVSKDALEKEKSHIADFSPEVAWVTHSGSTKMAEPVAIRPTSETVMYPAFAKWIQSHRDLPMKLNQWNNVVRWEFKQPTPFLRTREFLWQEGHTAHATKEEAVKEVHQILELYARVYEELLAIPVVRGRKSEKEKFAGSDFSTTTEAFVSASGRGIQGATSHHLGQRFAKMFDIIFDDPKTNEKSYVYQNSWGLTTRTIGVMVMVHGDNKGLVLPPRVASIQTIIMAVGITAKTTAEEKEKLIKSCEDLSEDLASAGIRAKCDLRDNVTPAWKFNHWELKGVPLRIELGPREVSSGNVFVVRRDNSEKVSFSRSSVSTDIASLLEQIQSSLYEKAKQDADSRKVLATDWNVFVSELDKRNVILCPFCGVEECEDEIKKDSANDEGLEPGAPSMGAKSLCIPFDQPRSVDGLKCIHPKCGRSAQFFTLFGRSY